jgi:Kef-type K+ transport system membrane component KefB
MCFEAAGTMIAAAIRSEPAYAFLLVATIIIFGPLLAEKIKLPGLIGLLIGGAVIGPNMLGLLDDFSGLQAFGDIGVLYLIFLAGLGLDMKTFQRYRNVALTFGLITATIPWALGTGVALLDDYELKTAIFIGSFWASFTLVSYSVVTKFGLTRNASIAATVGASSITDTIGLLTLALVVGSETGDDGGLVLILRIALGLIIVAGYCLAVLPTITGWFFAGMGQERELRFMMVLAGFTSAAVVASLVEIEPLIGAFFAGLGLNRLVPNESRLMARVDFFGNALFIPAFLVSVGLLVDPSVMFGGSTLRIAAGLAVALVIGKAAAAWLTGRIYGFSAAEVGLMFSLSTAQAAATLASTIIGFELGLYGENIVNAVMVVIVISLFVSGLGSAHFGPLVKPTKLSEPRLGQAIVVPLDEERDPGDALWLGGKVAKPDGGVVIPLAIAATEDSGAVDRLRSKTDELRSELRSLGLTGDPEMRVAQSVSRGVARFALERDASLVLMSWPGPSDFRTVMLGGTNDEISTATDRPVALAALTNRSPERVILLVSKAGLSPGLVATVRLAVEMATRVAEADGLPILVGPATPAELESAGIAMPEAVDPGSDDGGDAGRVLRFQFRESDLLVVPTVDNPGDRLARLVSSGASAVAIGRRWGNQQYSSEGALGVTVPTRTDTASDMEDPATPS